MSHQFNHLHNDIIDRVTLHPEQQNNKEYIQEYTLKYNNLQNNVIKFTDFIRNKIVDKFKNFRIIPNNLLSVFDTNIGSFVFKRERTNSRIFIRDKSPTNAISL